MQLLDLDSTPIREMNKKPQNENQLFDMTCHYHIDKLKILNLVANLRSAPSPDDYTKDISILTGNALPIDSDCVLSGDGECVTSADDEGIANTAESSQTTPVEGTPDLSADLNFHSNGSAMNGTCNSHTIESTDPIPIKSEIPNEPERPQIPSKPNVTNCEPLNLSRTKSIGNRSESIASTDDHYSSKYSTLSRKKRNSDGTKPPNVLVYSESNDCRANVIATIRNILHPDRYTIYELKTEQLKTTYWFDITTLLIVCGQTSPQVGAILMEYFLCGGKMLCLCSDVLNMVLPIYRTAEVRESELVQFSYSRWHKIQLMHHIFCYHRSPIKKHFSLEADEQFDGPPKPYVQTVDEQVVDEVFSNDEEIVCCRLLTCPGSIDFKDLRGDVHRLVVKVLGTEETWNTPSLILATDTCCSGIALFSQVFSFQRAAF